MSKKKVDPLQLADEASRAFTLQAEEASRAMKKQADEKNTIKIVFGTSGQYPDGTSWERDATEEEAAKYDSWCK